MKSAHPVCCSPRSCSLAAFVVAACGETKDENTASSDATATPSSAEATADPSAEIPQGLKTVSIPKQLGNPYEEFEHSGIDEALKELGGSNRISGPTDAGASTQIPIINAAIQQKPDAIIIAGNDPNAVAPGAQAGRGEAASRSSAWTPTWRPMRAASSSTRSRPSWSARTRCESIAKQIDNKGEIAILSATANATNQNAWIKVMKDEL